MAPVVDIRVGSRTYPTVEDVELSFGVLLRGRVLDEVGDAPPTPFTVRTQLRHTFVKTREDGAFAIAGVADRVFPDLAATGYAANVEVEAPRVPRRRARRAGAGGIDAPAHYSAD